MQTSVRLIFEIFDPLFTAEWITRRDEVIEFWSNVITE